MPLLKALLTKIRVIMVMLAVLLFIGAGYAYFSGHHYICSKWMHQGFELGRLDKSSFCLGTFTEVQGTDMANVLTLFGLGIFLLWGTFAKTTVNHKAE